MPRRCASGARAAERINWPTHVGLLDLSARKLPLDVQKQANERKTQRDRLVVVIRSLRGKGVDNVLVHRGRIAVREGVTAQLIVGVLL